MTKEKMLERAESLGIKVDGRWSDFRLAQEIEKAEAAVAAEAAEVAEEADADDAVESPEIEQPVKLVKMFRERDARWADVHPDNVGDYVKADYVVKAD